MCVNLLFSLSYLEKCDREQEGGAAVCSLSDAVTHKVEDKLCALFHPTSLLSHFFFQFLNFSSSFPVVVTYYDQYNIEGKLYTTTTHYKNACTHNIFPLFIF